MVSLILYWWKWIFDPKFELFMHLEVSDFFIGWKCYKFFKIIVNSDFAIDNTKCFFELYQGFHLISHILPFFQLMDWEYWNQIDPRKEPLNGTTGNVLQTN